MVFALKENVFANQDSLVRVAQLKLALMNALAMEDVNQGNAFVNQDGLMKIAP
jgi:hypothetical protein